MTHVIADDPEAGALTAEPAAQFAREAALRDAGRITLAEVVRLMSS
ncbi:hypothetical protein GR925_33670 [Streptomyces sp. HUCO-GS316]|nr:hypothetical protein [Streptomyces sp. HUCO-GS316]MXM68254.1 hypothetical protein [Streptomyces sp. HUCO-GS316]